MTSTAIALPPTNMTQLLRWYRDENRRREISLLLMATKELPHFPTSTVPLLKARDLPAETSQPVHPLIIAEPEDIVGKAKVCSYGIAVCLE